MRITKNTSKPLENQTAPAGSSEQRTINQSEKLASVQTALHVGESNQLSDSESENTAKTPAVSSFIQRKSEHSATPVTDSIDNQIESSRGSGQTIDHETKSFMQHRFGESFDNVHVHTDTNSGQLARSLNAKAFTVGDDIYFKEGNYNPGSAEGRKLLAHELTHTIQQSGSVQSVQRDTDVVNMPPLTVTAGMPDTAPLSTPVPAGGMSATITANPANTQLPETPLPFTASGWDGNDIASKLGQYDRIPGTDSDAVRCVQSVALMSHILIGPSAANAYLNAIALQGLLQSSQPENRKRTARQVIYFVRRRIENRQATYGNMYWAMEAVHDLFLNDTSGTPAGTADPVRAQITPSMDLSQSMVNMDVWCADRAELLAQASRLNAGEQLMLNTWSVSFNFNFDEAGFPLTQRSGTIELTDEEGHHPRQVTIRRIDASRKPRASQIDLNRDRKSGHQMLIYKDAANSHIKMYEPENTPSGNHLFDLTDDPSAIESSLFNDQPAFELYKYVQLWGKIVPAPATSAFGM
ncbi:DUF4157 domain-containing protein [Pedobacter sp. HMF7647]|uniref:DUF4157 domain-containing protein n=1 Tax=Hufsiella arboris TaxID=2695275 RepID=A0A7K1Y524_9SPHI|nr:DUF4157 domain-containing protein [Hufsiella arboris]MXV49682.1 DUF4157 domain-containing protein [Hufsiella arboris]